MDFRFLDTKGRSLGEWFHVLTSSCFNADTAFLLRFLRYCKFSQLEARKRLETYLTAMTKYAEYATDIDMTKKELQIIHKTRWVKADICTTLFLQRGFPADLRCNNNASITSGPHRLLRNNDVIIASCVHCVVGVIMACWPIGWPFIPAATV